MRTPTLILLGACTAVLSLPTLASTPSAADVIRHYADLGEAMYADALAAAKALQTRVDVLLTKPSSTTLQAARDAWISAREPYLQTEVFRFGNPIVDEWEGKVNAWPLDEGLIDYVAPAYGEESPLNPFYTANIIANTELTLGGQTLDLTTIDRVLLREVLHEIDAVEANVATGYHAVEFMLWGQDLNGTGPGAGNRPATDFDVSLCTGAHCERRRQYLAAVTELLVDDLAWMAAQWRAGGAARSRLLDNDPELGIAAMLTGMGSLSYGELAGERMKLGLMVHDPEEEQDCFSDNTHAAHYFSAKGIRNIYLGEYTTTSGKTLSGPSLLGYAQALAKAASERLAAALEDTESRMDALVARARQTEAYDQMIAAGNDAGNAIVAQAIEGLLQQTKAIEALVSALSLKAVAIEGSDSLDAQ